MITLIFIYLQYKSTHPRSSYYVWAIIFYIIMLIETAVSKTHGYLSHVVAAEHINQHINELRGKPPTILFHIQCYHYEWRVVHRHGRMETVHERVDTHFAE
jgi:hypothetical protein